MGLSDMDPLWMLKYCPICRRVNIAIYNDLRGPNNSLTMPKRLATWRLVKRFGRFSAGTRT